MKQLLILFLSIALLVACAPGRSEPTQPAQEVFITATLPPTKTPWPASNTPSVTPTPTTDSSIFAQLFPGSNVNSELTRIDQQGEVVVQVTPINLDMPGDTLDFEISLETHSVELNMNLVNHATLITDTRIVVQPIGWDGPIGGHHVSGTLTFPVSVDGGFILDGVTELIMEIRDVDAELRTFEWILP